MHSEFHNVALDQVRYSLVWEDSETLYAGLKIQPTDRVLVISSAGCNALNVLLKKPASVTAIDLNPVQNKLLHFKKYLIRHFEFQIFRGLLGLDGPDTVAKSWEKVEAILPDALKIFWQAFFQRHPQGLLLAGKLENYLTGFYHTLPRDQQTQLQELLLFNEVSEQAAFFANNLHKSSFREKFISYFDEANLSKGRDPKLFKYAQESGGEAFYNRLQDQLSKILVRDNFFFRFFFFGPENIPENILPPCYQMQHFNTLREQLDVLEIITGEASDYLLSPSGKSVTKASLSNIFEYTSAAEFQKVCREIYGTNAHTVQIIFWNLLQDQGQPEAGDIWETHSLSEKKSVPGACFYFRNARVISPCLITV